MEDYQLTAVATDYLLKGEFEKSWIMHNMVLKNLLNKYAGLNRVTFYDLTNLKKGRGGFNLCRSLV